MWKVALDKLVDSVKENPVPFVVGGLVVGTVAGLFMNGFVCGRRSVIKLLEKAAKKGLIAIMWDGVAISAEQFINML